MSDAEVNDGERALKFGTRVKGIDIVVPSHAVGGSESKGEQQELKHENGGQSLAKGIDRW